MKSEIDSMIGYDENVYWRGKPDKKCFFLESVFNPFMPFALIWLLIDGTIIGGFIGSRAVSQQPNMVWFMLFFFAIHLMPVWLYVGGLLLIVRRHRNIEYVVTDKAIYVSSGTWTSHVSMKPLNELSDISVRRGIFDKKIGVGDVITHEIQICDIAEYEKVFKMIKQLQTNLYSDTMYPNDLRPETNVGNRTTYTGYYNPEDYDR